MYDKLIRLDHKRLADKITLNEKLELFIEKKREHWKDQLSSLFDMLKSDDKKEMINSQALALSYHQQLQDDITSYLIKLSKGYAERNNFQRDRFLFYSTSFSIKTNKAEKDILLDADLSEDNKYVRLLEAYIDYLRDCKSLCESIQWLTKNKIQILML
jgi:prephenate dehydrogenase